MWGALMGGLASLAGGLLGGGGRPKIDQAAYNQAQNWLSMIFKDSQNPFYEGNLMQLIDWFGKGGTATEGNRQKAISQVLAPINQMIPDARTRLQNSMARSGINLPGTVQIKGENDLATQAAYQRGQAIESVNQRFDERLDQNKALSMSASGNMASLLKNLGLSAATASGNMALQQQGQQMAQASMGTNWAQLLTGMGGSLLSNALGGLSASAAPAGGGIASSVLGGGGADLRAMGGLGNPFASSYLFG